MSTSPSALESLRRETLLSLVPNLYELAVEKGSIKLLEAGTVLCKQGDTIFSLHIPISNHLLLKQEEAGEEKTLGYIQKRRSLFIREILEGKPAPFTAIAETTTTVFTLPAKYLLEELSKQDYVMSYMKCIVNSAGIRSLKHLLEENEVDQGLIFHIIGSFQEEPIALSKGDSIDLGKPWIYAIDRGTIVLRPSDLSEDFHVVELREGSWFGGEALVPPYEYKYVAEASENTIVRKLSLAKVSAEIDVAGVTDQIVAEPWISRVDRDPFHSKGKITDLPGIDVDPSMIRDKLPHFDFSNSIGAQSDFDSWSATAATIASLKGFDVSNSNIRNDIKIAGKTTFLTVAEALEPYGIIVSPLAFSYANILDAGLPTVVTYGPRLVVLLKATKTGVLIADPVVGFRFVLRDDFERLWNGVVLDVECASTDSVRVSNALEKEGQDHLDEREKKKALMWRVARKIYQLYWKYPSLNINILLFALASLLLGLVGPKIAQFMMDEVLALRDLNTMVVLIMASAILLFTNLTKEVCATYLTVASSIRFETAISTQFYRHALSSPTASRGSNNVGDFTARYGAMNSFKAFITTVPTKIIFSLLSILIYSAMLVTYDPTIAMVALSLIPFVGLIRWSFKRAMRNNYELSFQQSKRGTGLMMEILSSIAAIKATGVDQKIRHAWEENTAQGVELRRINAHLSKGMGVVVDFFTSGVQMGCLWLGCSLAMKGEISLGEVMAINMYTGSLIGPLKGLSSLASSYEAAVIDGRRMAEFFAVNRDEDLPAAQRAHSVRFKGKVKLERLNFRYAEDEKWVIKNVDLTIYPRQVVALVGGSGCGKTTLANLIAGNLKASTGRIYFDDFNSDLVSLSCKRRQVGFMMQDSELLSGSILDNIAYSDDDPNYKEVDIAAMNSASSEFINRLPQRYMTHLAEGGLGLSGGQKQRIAIARTIYRDPTILLLDEATSSLDSQSESSIVNSMRAFLKNKTAIIIAHRYSTIRNADRIVVMKDGEIVEDGTHEELVRLKGHYCELFINQMTG